MGGGISAGKRTPAAPYYAAAGAVRAVFGRNRTPSSSMNSTPAASNARRNADKLARIGWRYSSSNALIVETLTIETWASSGNVHLRNALAARH